MDQKRLRQLEDQCIQDCAPPCSAACPVHVDVRAITRAVGQGDFAAALKHLRKTVPYPGIVGRICDQPCRSVCHRGAAGGAINIAALERSAADYGGAPAEKSQSMPARDQRVAVVGGGLSGATAALELVKRGYGVAVFEATHHLGGDLWSYPPEILPGSLVEAELSVLTRPNIEIHLNTTIDSEAYLAELSQTFGAVYLATGRNTITGLELPMNEAGYLQTDPATYNAGLPWLFAGGNLVHAALPIQAISDGRRAVVSIDRHLQRVSLTAARPNEGAYTTRLFTQVQGMAPVPEVPLQEAGRGYAPEGAAHEAARCLQCECLECVKVCEYLAHFGSYPRKYVREIYNNLSIITWSRRANGFINACMECGLCAEVCPEHLDMGAVCGEARQEMVQKKKMPPSAHDFALRDMAFSNSAQFALARHAPGATRSDYVFFPGCQLAGSSPEYVEKVYDDLRSRLGNVGLMLGCCGAPAAWAGRSELAQATIAHWQAEHRSLGTPRIVVACSSCYQVFKSNWPQVEIISLWEIIDQWGLPDAAAAHRQADPLVVHDPCTTRYASQIQESVRHLLRRLGYTIDELPLSREKTECCSYGGLLWFANRELAQKVVRRRIAENPADYITYCAVCRDFFAGQGKRTLHLLDLIYSDDLDRRATRPDPGYSQRHENRARLKRKLLKDLWGEAMEAPPSPGPLRLVIPDDVRACLEQRLILVEDLQRVIELAERTGRKLLNRGTGHWLAYHRPTAVTYWVEYSAEGAAFVIHNAYSHRMEIAAPVPV